MATQFIATWPASLPLSLFVSEPTDAHSPTIPYNVCVQLTPPPPQGWHSWPMCSFIPTAMHGRERELARARTEE